MLLGLLGGFLSVLGIGGTLYFQHKLFDDDLQYIVSFEAIQYLSDGFGLPEDYQLAEPFSIGGRLIVTYSF